MICLFFVIFGLGFSTLSIVLIAKDGSDINYTPWIIVGALFGLPSSIIFLFLVLQFEAIKGDTIFYRRFIKIKRMSIHDIESIEPREFDFLISAKDGSRFIVSFGTEKLDILLKTICDKLNNNSIYSVQYIDYDIKELHKNTFPVLISMMFCFLVAGGLSSLGSFVKPVEEEKLVIVEGEFEYIRQVGKGHYGIGIKKVKLSIES